MPAGMPGKGGGGVIRVTAPALLLNIVLHGNSVLEGSGVSTPQKPLALIQSALPTALVSQGTMGGDINTLIGSVASVTSQYVSGRRNIAALLESNNYLDDTRGEAAFGGDGFTLSDPSGAALACYNLCITWANAVIAAGFEAMIVTSPASYETTASPLSNNTQYQAAAAALATLHRASGSRVKFPRIADCAADSRLQTPSDTTYYDGTQIHLTAAGYAVEAGLIVAAATS